MLNSLLLANKKLRSYRPLCADGLACTFFHQANMLEIALPSEGCIYDRSGNCIMCDYGQGHAISDLSTLNTQVDKILNSFSNQYDLLVLCTNGSFFDKKNISKSQRRFMLKKAQESEATTILFESHSDLINRGILQEIRQYIPSKAVGIEIGIESINQNVRKLCLLKQLDIQNVDNLFNMLDEFGIFININILLGAPFLNIRQQLTDTIDTITWASAKGTDIVLFPMNIKPFTLLEYMYKHDMYKPISHWLLIELLNQIKELGLQNITLAWYGNRVIDYKNSDIVPVFPQSCPVCYPFLMQFYDDYNATESNTERLDMLNRIIKQGETMCACYNTTLKGINSATKRPVDPNDIYRAQAYLVTQLENDGILL